MTVDARHVTAYLERGWALARSLEHEHWAREFAERGSGATFDAAQALWRHMRLVDPDWPSEQERLEDLAHHLALKAAIDHAANRFGDVPGR